MKRLLCLAVVLLIAAAPLTGCSSASKADKSSAADMALAYGKSAANNAEAKSNGSKSGTSTANEAKAPAEAPKADSNATALTGVGVSDIAANNTILSQRKVIRNANVTVEVEDFDVAYGKVKSLISAFGFIQESSIKKEKFYIQGEEKLLTKGIITIRVDKDKFDSMLSDIKGLGVLLDENIKGDDVTDKYFDTESSLRLLKYEQSRLEQYLLKLTDPDIIFKTESRLTQIRQDIEKLTGTLNKWNDLVELSTITINMNEKRPSQQDTKEKTYFQKLSEGFSDSLKGVASFCGALLIFIVQALPVLVLLALLLIPAIWVYRKFLKGRSVGVKGPESKDKNSNV